MAALDLRKSRTPLVILNSPKPLLALLGFPLLLSHLALPGFQCSWNLLSLQQNHSSSQLSSGRHEASFKAGRTPGFAEMFLVLCAGGCGREDTKLTSRIP